MENFSSWRCIRRHGLRVPTYLKEMPKLQELQDELGARGLAVISISVDEALRTTISAGVLIPPNESVEELTQNLAAILGRPLDAEA